MLRLNSQLTDYEEIFAYGDTPEDFAMLALAPTTISRWDEAPPGAWQRQATQVKMARDCPSHQEEEKR